MNSPNRAFLLISARYLFYCSENFASGNLGLSDRIPNDVDRRSEVAFVLIAHTYIENKLKSNLKFRSKVILLTV